MRPGTPRVMLYCQACDDAVTGWGVEDWRACPRCHHCGTLFTVPPLKVLERCQVCGRPIEEKSVKYDAWIHEDCAGEFIGYRGE